MAFKKSSKGEEVQIRTIQRGTFVAHIVGTSPLICNAMSAKARQELLCPAAGNKRKSGGLKHDVLQEFRDSMYTDRDKSGPTVVQGLSAWFKSAMVKATVDLPDASKAGVGRNVWVRGERVALYGTPQLMMSVVRSAGMNKTPDIRTRAILPEWACDVTVDFASPMLTPKAVSDLLAVAGIVMGVGDWRPEKGSGSYGQFQVVEADDKDYKTIVKQGRKIQEAAIANPETYDGETDRLRQWFDAELQRRGAA